jgi:hypothetical protein
MMIQVSSIRYHIRQNGLKVPVGGIQLEGTELGINEDPGGGANVTHIPSGYRIGCNWDSLSEAIEFGQRISGMICNGDGSKKGPRWCVEDPEKEVRTLEREIKEEYGCSGMNNREKHSLW